MFSGLEDKREVKLGGKTVLWSSLFLFNSWPVSVWPACLLCLSLWCLVWKVKPFSANEIVWITWYNFGRVPTFRANAASELTLESFYRIHSDSYGLSGPESPNSQSLLSIGNYHMLLGLRQMTVKVRKNRLGTPLFHVTCLVPKSQEGIRGYKTIVMMKCQLVIHSELRDPHSDPERAIILKSRANIWFSTF